MCYIMGFYTGTRDIETASFLEHAEEQLLIRGRDAVGFYAITLAGEESISRVLLTGDKKAQLKQFLSRVPSKVCCLMLQTRAIPEPEMIGHLEKGGLKVDDTQPFSREGWTVSHNGTVANDRELREQLTLVDWERETSVDSVVLPYLFAWTVGGVPSVLRSTVDGSFAIAAFNKGAQPGMREFWLAKNFQPLYWSQGWIDDGVVSYSSLKTEYAQHEVPAYVALVFNDSGIGQEVSLYRKPDEKSVVVVHSSGLDSTTSARLYQVLGYKVAALHFEYGQQAQSVERYCSEEICKTLRIPWHCMSFPTKGFKSALLEEKKEDLDPLWDAESTYSYVPQRNLIMASMALAFAEDNEYSAISLGFNLADGSGYPDNCVPFVETLNKITSYSSNWQTKLRVSSPFINLMKSEIVEIGLKIGVPFDRVCSCYYPTLTDDGHPIYCGNCGCETLYSYAWQKLGYRPPNFGFEGLGGHLRYPKLKDTDPGERVSFETIPYHYVIKETI